MTYKELYLKEHPEEAAFIDCVIISKCPRGSNGEFLGPCPAGCETGSNDVRCHKCWDREIPEEKTEDSESKKAVELGRQVCEGFQAGMQAVEEKAKFEPKLSDDKETAEAQIKLYEELGLIPKFKPLTQEEFRKLCASEAPSIKDIEVEPEVEIGSMKVESTDHGTCIKDSGFKGKNLIPEELTKGIEQGIKDSGSRREFSTGAVRDIQEGKGRCDLMPLDVVGHLMYDDPVIFQIHEFTNDGDPEHLICALQIVAKGNGYPWLSISSMLLDVAKHFEAGAKKYGEWNWQKGIPTHCYIDSAVRHFLKCACGYNDEPHDRAFVWNILCCIWTCKHKPELNDYPRKETKND